MFDCFQGNVFWWFSGSIEYEFRVVYPYRKPINGDLQVHTEAREYESLDDFVGMSLLSQGFKSSDVMTFNVLHVDTSPPLSGKNGGVEAFKYNHNIEVQQKTSDGWCPLPMQPQ